MIPAYNAGPHLTSCLKALSESANSPFEVIVVDDGSTDDTRERAGAFPVKVLESGGRKGPGFARNLGAREAAGDILLFLDSDVCVQTDTIGRILRCFEADPALDAVMGSYNSTPECLDFLSQYRNLMHTYVHQTGDARASTFWSGCGAIVRKVFLQHGGFEESRRRPAIEDIELGYRLILSGRKVLLDRSVQVTHLKRWTFWKIVKTDILDRGIPWTELILRTRFMPNDLNLQVSQQISVACASILAALTAILIARNGAFVLIPMLAFAFFMLTGWWSEFGASNRPRLGFAALSLFAVALAAEAFSHRMLALALSLIFCPVFLLLIRSKIRQKPSPAWRYWLRLVYFGAALCTAVMFLPPQRMCFIAAALLGLLLTLNVEFYIFLGRWRGMLFMLASIPFHLLYHFYNGWSFLFGLGHHCLTEIWRTDRHRVRGAELTLSPMSGEDEG